MWDLGDVRFRPLEGRGCMWDLGDACGTHGIEC